MPQLTGRSGPGQQVIPEGLRGYLFHGMHLDWSVNGKEAIGECPFGCDKEKFYINIETTKWNCFPCGINGNLIEFMRRLWELSDKETREYSSLRTERKLLHDETLMYWGVCKSILNDEWLVPGYNTEGKLNQLYSYRVDQKTGKRVLLPTPTLPHQLHGSAPFSIKGDVWICEGPWDGMALWEAMKLAGIEGEVIAVPGCGVFHNSWLPFFAKRKVSILFDSDHPSKLGLSAGFVGMKRCAGLLLGIENKHASEIHYLNWGEKGYDPDRKHGYDVRDFLSDGMDEIGRVSALERLLAKITPIPSTWKAIEKDERKPLSSMYCDNWGTLVDAWRKALKWRKGLEDVLAVMLSVALSTDQAGNQLFLQVVGSAGSGKSNFCDGMLVSKKCFALEHLTGFHSGTNDGTGKDFSLISRINHKTLITPEGDVIISSPRFSEIMSQQRRIFDGTSGATYKNRSEDIRYAGLRTPWIIAGTFALLDTDQSRLGDRFIRICIDPPTEEEKQAILYQVGWTAIRCAAQVCTDGIDSGIMDQRLRTAYKLTGGYVDWLRDNSERLLKGIEGGLDMVNGGILVAKCSMLAQFAADLRARPANDRFQVKEHDANKELPSRIQHQLVRLSMCLAAVTNQPVIGSEISRVVTKVTVDMSRGKTLDIVRHLYKVGGEGVGVRSLGVLTNQTEDQTKRLIFFLRKIDCVEPVIVNKVPGIQNQQVKWALTNRLRELYDEVFSDVRE